MIGPRLHVVRAHVAMGRTHVVYAAYEVRKHVAGIVVVVYFIRVVASVWVCVDLIIAQAKVIVEGRIYILVLAAVIIVVTAVRAV